MDWISVKERLPEEQTGVLIAVKDCRSVIAQVWNGRWTDVGESGLDYEQDDVTHWMPLPEPPASEQA